MSDTGKNIIYSAVDIEKYFSGRLSAGQMHEMEKAALDDVFLAEAMEGYEGMKNKNWKHQLAAVRSQITEIESEAKIVPMHRSTGRWWKTAAAVLVIGSGATLTFILTKNRSEENPNPQIAQTITTPPDSVTAKDKTTSSAETSSTKDKSSSDKENTTSANGTISQINPQGSQKDNVFNFKPGNATLADTITTDRTGLAKQPPGQTVSEKPVLSETPIINVPSSANNNSGNADVTLITMNKEKAKQNNADAETFKRQTAPAVNKKEQSLNNYFNAQVLAADNSPLPFTNISIKSENFGTYADVKGNFRLVSADTVLNIEVRSVGYAPRTFSLHSNQPLNRIVLLEDEMSVREKTIIINNDNSKNIKSRRATLIIDSVVNVEPADGWENYNTYVANNLDIPEEMLKKDFHGEVELSFDVKAGGAISNIRVNKSLGAAYDDAARQ